MAKVHINDDPVKDLEGFEITCKKCKSTDVLLEVSEAYEYSEWTSDSGSAIMICNACGAVNELMWGNYRG